MNEMRFVVKEGSGLDTEELMRDFFDEIEPRIFELLEAITRERFSISKVGVSRRGKYDPAPKIVVKFNGENLKEEHLRFIERLIRSEHPTKLKIW